MEKHGVTAYHMRRSAAQVTSVADSAAALQVCRGLHSDLRVGSFHASCAFFVVDPENAYMSVPAAAASACTVP